MAGFVWTKDVHAASVTCDAGEGGSGRVRTNETVGAVETTIIDNNRGIILGRAVVVDLP
jgi:hypothetical protein